MYSILDNPEIVRENVRRAFINDFNLDQNVSINMEISIFNYSIETSALKKTLESWSNPYFVLIYSNKLKTILANLNSETIERLANGEIHSNRIAYYSAQELAPSKWKTLIENKERQDKNKYEPVIQASTDVFTCGKCREKKCTYSQQQIRSSDEAITTFVTCLVCDNHWTC
jgi:transcription elongation factor S-II